jgi:hypothetical protein
MDMDRCIAACLDCHRNCLATIQHCLGLGGHHAEAGHIRLMMDCAQICATSADFMIRGSEHHPHLCAECAEICRQCAEECEGHPGADEAMRACAASCRACAEECGRMGRPR